MRFTEVEELRSEIGTVERFLEETHEDSIVMRMTWEGRLETLRERLDAAERRPQPYPLTLAFLREPVDGVQSIDAGFAGKVVKAFIDATNAVAANFTGVLQERGQLPGAARSRSLRIIGTTTGSFGFDLELPPAELGETSRTDQVGMFDQDDDTSREDAESDVHV